MEQFYRDKLNRLGYNQLVCDIFPKWEDVKDEILVPERKSGTGNGTIHVFLGAADYELQKEFSAYYHAVNNGEDPSVGAVEVKHYFLVSNVLSMLGYVCQYYFSRGQSSNDQVKTILSQLSSYPSENGLLETNSFFKLSTGASRLRPYFKQFEGNGVFTKLIRQLLLPNSGYKISLYKNSKGEYAAFWLIGFDWQTDFEANSNKSLFSDKQLHEDSIKPLQQIFYGAPGTGKSNTIKKVVDEQGKRCHRITFHPDSDYSTFVGAYKPTMKSSERIYSPEELTIKLKEIKTTGTTYPCHKFAAKYWESLKDLTPDSIKQILNACGFTDNYSVEIGKGVAVGQEYLNNPEDGKIIYTFCPQAFTNAYVEAWNTEEEVYLVIEEINRGNCAQIFGDLFQLLDRKNSVSEYPVEADADLQSYLNKTLAKTTRTDIPDDVKSGEKLMLPSNLYIWATMNTSDQSLFPIDSAFKRRWDWKYIPISDAGKNYVIEIDNDQYDWWSFLTAINTIIESTTHSEDKKLGYFFAKAKDGRITADTFVSKVIFYLWNDVFKDNESNHKAFKDSNGEMLAFHRFFHDDGSVNTNVVIKFLQDLEVYPFEVLGDGTSAPNITVPNAKRQRDNSRYSVNGTDNLNKAQMTREAFRQYIEAHPEADAQTIAQAWRGLGLKNDVQHLVETEDEFKARTENSIDTNKRATEFELSNGEKVYLSTQFGIGNIGKFIDAVNNAGWNIRIDKLA